MCYYRTNTTVDVDSLHYGMFHLYIFEILTYRPQWKQ